MKRKINILFPALLLAVSLTGCRESSPASSEEAQMSGPETVSLTVWGAEEDEELLSQIIDGFLGEYRQQADFHITYQPQSESTVWMHCWQT